MKRLLFILALLLCVSITTSAFAIDFTDASGGSTMDPEPDSLQDTTVDDYQQIPVSSQKDDGVIRVYLKSLNLPTSMTITLNGEYTLGHDSGYRFKSGTTIILSDGGDRIYMSVGGFTMDMGQKVELTRQASDSGDGGLVIAETQRANIYPGDLTVTRQEAGGGLMPVLSVNIEDYLLGVVAYEMSDSWPVEALKSQAVAARTYAMQRKKANASKSYDLVDTTADQVYRGTDPSYLNVAAAVKATQGVVGMYKGNYAICYYTASNGGEVAIPSDVWESAASADYGYLERKEDPYDLENTKCVVKTLSISDDCSESPELLDIIENDVIAQAEAEGKDTSGLCVDTILSMEPVDPIPEDSHMYRTLRLTVSVSREVEKYTASPDDIGAPAHSTGITNADMALAGVDILRRTAKHAGYESELVLEESDDTYTVDIDVYNTLKPMGLAINTLDCELISVESGQFGYTISARRFGHGVGMSQRGAQCMAGSHDMTWREILAFYYPGMELVRIDWDTPALEKLEELPSTVGMAFVAATPTPSPAPLPALSDGEHYAVVVLSDASSTLNMRAMPTTESRSVAMLSSGQRLIVSSATDENGWVSVHTAEYSGYVKAEYLRNE